MRQEFDIKTIYKAMYDMAKKVCKYVYTSDRPEATKSKPEAFCVLVLPSGLSDYLALGTATAKFELYIRDRDNGTEDLDVLSKCQDGLLSQLPCTTENGYQFNSPYIVPYGSDGKGFHLYSIITNLIII